MWAQVAANPGRSQSSTTIDFTTFDVKHKSNTLVRSSTSLESPSQRLLPDTSIISGVPILLPCYDFTTSDSLHFTTTINPHFCNPYYYPWQEEDEIRFQRFSNLNKQAKQKSFTVVLNSHGL